MTSVVQPKVFGTGLIALDLVIGPDPESPVRSWAGGTCGNVLSILSFLGWDAYPIARMNGDPAPNESGRHGTLGGSSRLRQLRPDCPYAHYYPRDTAWPRRQGQAPFLLVVS